METPSYQSHKLSAEEYLRKPLGPRSLGRFAPNRPGDGGKLAREHWIVNSRSLFWSSLSHESRPRKKKIRTYEPTLDGPEPTPHPHPDPAAHRAFAGQHLRHRPRAPAGKRASRGAWDRDVDGRRERARDVAGERRGARG